MKKSDLFGWVGWIKLVPVTVVIGTFAVAKKIRDTRMSIEKTRAKRLRMRSFEKMSEDITCNAPYVVIPEGKRKRKPYRSTPKSKGHTSPISRRFPE